MPRSTPVTLGDGVHLRLSDDRGRRHTPGSRPRLAEAASNSATLGDAGRVHTGFGGGLSSLRIGEAAPSAFLRDRFTGWATPTPGTDDVLCRMP